LTWRGAESSRVRPGEEQPAPELDLEKSSQLQS
jgi:hypothetical protein